MGTIKRLFCVLRGGHRWTTADDPAGGVTICSRCGKIRHTPGNVARDPWQDPVGGGE